MIEKYKPFVYGAISGILFAVFLLILSVGIIDHLNNIETYNKTITINGKICEDNFLDGHFVKIQDQDDITYFIDPTKCSDYTIGNTVNISYHKIHQLYSLSQFDFNRVSGKYGGWDY